MAKKKRQNIVTPADTNSSKELAKKQLMSRALVTQMQALRQYRTSSQIKMVVGSVSVSDGSQAIVGTVNQSAEKTSGEQDT